MFNKPNELSAQQKAERGRAKTRSFKMEKLDPYLDKEVSTILPKFLDLNLVEELSK